MTDPEITSRIKVVGADGGRVSSNTSGSGSLTREELMAEATKIHDDGGCRCDPKYLMSCARMAMAILEAGKAETGRMGA